MTIHIALIRGINVGGHKAVAMSELRDLLAGLGFSDARSLLQSGNLVFQSGSRTAVGLEHLLETEAEKRLGLRADFLVRSVGNGGRSSRAIHFARKPSGIPVIWWRCS